MMQCGNCSAIRELKYNSVRLRSKRLLYDTQNTIAVTASIVGTNILSPSLKIGDTSRIFSSSKLTNVFINDFRKNNCVRDKMGGITIEDEDCLEPLEGNTGNQLWVSNFLPSGNKYSFIRILQTAISVFFLFFFLSPTQSFAQELSQYEEVIFGFTLKELGSYNISVAVKNDKVYLPVIELFNIFEVYYTIQGQNIIKGTYLTSAFPLTIDPVKHEILLGNKQYVLTLDEMFKGDMDIYISTEKFEEIFGITSTVNFNRLQIIAETSKELPALVHKKTASERSEKETSPVAAVKYPLRYALDRSFLGGAVLDYNVTTTLDKLSSKGTSYTFTGGGEVAGGDIQGSLVGATGQSATFSDVRWRYVVRGNNYFSSLTAGQITTGSDYIPRVTGIALSNEPIEPRVMFDNYVVDGFTDPESEVELYLNDRLIGFQKTNAAGYYRFQFPLTYGTEKITVKTFSKYGDINVSEKQIQIPFSFVPKGILSYNLQAGKVANNPQLSNNAFFGNANLLYGATNWLTLNGGIEQSDNTGLQKPIYNFGFSSRLFSQYILNIDVAPDAYYRLDANALFASNAGVFASYAKFVLNDSLIGATPQQSASLALYLPFAFISSGTGFRISEDYADAVLGKNLSTRLDFSTRLTNVQLLMSYIESKGGTDLNPFNLNGNGLLTMTVMYMLSHGSFIPNFLQAFLLRGVAMYDLQAKTFQDASLQLSKTFMQIFQFNLGFERNFASNNTSFEVGLIMDLNFTRTSSVFDFSNENITSRQSLYGSVALDRGAAFLSNREQIDKGGIDVILFVDNNNNGKYDAGDELIPARGVKVDGMGKVELGRDSIIRVTELNSYFRYNLEVDRQQIDPNLVPTIDKFSFVVDPNQMRRIEIPFYRGGTISGNAYLEREGIRTPLSGGRIIMQATKGNFGDTLRTFADGGFYAMNVAPGSYRLIVDPVQLKFLQAVQQSSPLSVTVHHSQQGDLIEDLVIVCESLVKVTKPAQEVDTMKVIAKDTIRKFIVSLPGKRENIDSTISKEYTEPVTIPVQKESIDTSLHKEITETVPQPASKANGDSLLREEYADAVSLFREKKYEEAIVKFNSLLDKGIEKTLVGNCEYWMGECNYATRDYRNAIEHFQKVIAIYASNKKPDAYFMLGKSYEQTGELEKARNAYKELNEQYPDNVHARSVKSRLKALNNLLEEKRKTGDENHE
jgi:tol-pal system protein YbgF